MLRKIFFCNDRGGARILLLLLLTTLTFSKISAQVCPGDRFEIEKVPPAAQWRVNSTNTVPGAFHAFYRVKLKTKAGQPPFPASFTFNHLQLDGAISVNDFTSRINSTLTIQFSQTPYLQYLNIDPNVLGKGDIIWKVGSENNCEPGGGGGVQLPLPMGQTSVTLFTICVDAVPGDVLKWNNLGSSYTQCSGGVVCDGQLFISTGMPPGTTINFPPPNSFSPRRIFYEYAYDFGLSVPFVKVGLAPPQPGSGRYAKVDASIHIIPEMATASLNLIPSALSNGPSFNTLISRKNTDGSFDIYFSFEDFPPPATDSLASSDTLYVMAILLDGIYNISQGGLLRCSLNAGRWVSGSLANNNVTYRLLSTPSQTVINIPGNEPCDNNFKVTGSTYETQDCSGGIRFTLTHSRPTPISLKRLKLEFKYNPNAVGSAIIGTPSSNLPDAANSGTLITSPNNDFWTYSYDKIVSSNDSILIENGMYVDVPFEVDHNCVDYHVTIGEADPSPGSGGSYCALEVALGAEYCDPEVAGSVTLPNELEAPYYRVNLKDFNSPYDLEETNFCEPGFSFCPDQSQAPFFLEVETNPAFEDDYLCINSDNTGVTTYDLVLIQKHLKGTQLFTSVYQRFAADANGINNIQSKIDVELFRNLILGNFDNMDNDPNNDWPGAPNWRYIRKSIIFPTYPNDTLFYPKVPSIPGGADTCHVPINGIGDYGNFYAVKLGDLNYTCNCNNLRPGSGIVENSNAIFRVKASEVRQDGNVVSVPVYADAAFDLIALQGGFRFDPDLFELSAVVPNPELPIFDYHFGRSKAMKGELRFGWSTEQDFVLLPGKALLFTLQFKLKTGIGLPKGPLCWASDNIMQSVAYQENGTEYPVRLEWEGEVNDQQSLLGLVVSPNPFEENLTAFIYSEMPMQVTLLLTDSRGAVYARQSIELVSGDNVVNIQPIASTHPGVYFLSIEAKDQRLQRRVVKL
jgi:hypothetical protein